jgi:hypothetical protein
MVKADGSGRHRRPVMAERTTHSFHSKRGFHLFWGIVVVILGVGLVIGEVAALADPSSKWAQGSSPWEASWAIPLGLLGVWLGIRLLRIRLEISSGQMTIRGYLVTRTVNVSDIRAISLQPNENIWKPRVELAEGRGFWIQSFDCGPASKPPKPRPAATVEEVRVLLGLGAKGISTRHSRQDDQSGLPGDLASLNEPRDDGQRPDRPAPWYRLQVAPPPGHDQELDSYGVPVQYRSAKRLAYLVAAGGVIFGTISVWLAVMDIRHRLPGYLTFLGVLAAFLAWCPTVVVDVDDKTRKKHLGWVIWALVWAGFILSLVGFSGLMSVTCNCGG